MVNGEDQQIIQSVGQTWPQTVFGSSGTVLLILSPHTVGWVRASGRADG